MLRHVLCHQVGADPLIENFGQVDAEPLIEDFGQVSADPPIENFGQPPTGTEPQAIRNEDDATNKDPGVTVPASAANADSSVESLDMSLDSLGGDKFKRGAIVNGHPLEISVQSNDSIGKLKTNSRRSPACDHPSRCCNARAIIW